MILLNQYSSLQEAEIVAGMLRSNGIAAQVDQGALSSVYPSLDLLDSQISVYVPETQAEKALQLIRMHGDM